MNILIRCDSSNIIGTGHVMRCLNFCEYYPENKYTFLCKNFNDNISQKIIKNHNLLLYNYEIEPTIDDYKTWIGCITKKEVDIILNVLKTNKYNEIIIDHYGIDYEIEFALKQYVNKITVISDIFDYKHFCDVFINYNTDNELEIKQININTNTVIKCGISNIIINKKFLNIKKTFFRDTIEKICIMMGGSDPKKYTLSVINKIMEIKSFTNIELHVIIGKSNSYYDIISKYCMKYSNIKLYYDINYDELIKLYLDIDLCIGSLSITAYERLYMNVPQICIKIVDNQNIQKLKEFNIIENIEELIYILSNNKLYK